MIAIIPVLFVVVGLLMYALCANPKLSEVGRIIFACSFLVVMWAAASHVVKIL